MSHHHHNHPLPPSPRDGGSHIPNNVYGVITGKVDGPLSDADNNHVFIPVRISEGATGAGLHKIAFNVESNAPPKAAEYLVQDEAITDGDFPEKGFTTDATLSYTALGLTQNRFKKIENGLLRTVVHSSVDAAEIVAVYGFTFPGGGLHDIHYNNGEQPGSSHPNHRNQDGALSLYFHDSTGRAIRRWIFIKFQSQIL
jgi:hypothetical protein